MKHYFKFGWHWQAIKRTGKRKTYRKSPIYISFLSGEYISKLKKTISTARSQWTWTLGHSNIKVISIKIFQVCCAKKYPNIKSLLNMVYLRSFKNFFSLLGKISLFSIITQAAIVFSPSTNTSSFARCFGYLPQKN